MPKGRQQAASLEAIMKENKLYALQHPFLSFFDTVFKAVSAFLLETPVFRDFIMQLKK